MRAIGCDAIDRIGLDREELAARAHATARSVSAGCVVPDRGDVGAGLGQRERDALAQAGVGAGDQGDSCLRD